MKLGNMEDAQLIYRRRRTGFGPLPKGWKKLGSGSFRTSYLSPDGVVYKVCFDDDHSFNVLEFENFRRMRSKRIRLPAGWRLPAVKMYTFKAYGKEIHIVAMQYIEGKHVKCPKDIGWEDFDQMLEQEHGAVSAFGRCDIYDMHEENFVVAKNGKKYIIDLGE